MSHPCDYYEITAELDICRIRGKHGRAFDYTARWKVTYYEKTVVRNISFSLKPGEILGIAGESGSGEKYAHPGGSGDFGGRADAFPGAISGSGVRNLPDVPEKEMRRIRGAQIGIIFQDARRFPLPDTHDRRSDS